MNKRAVSQILASILILVLAIIAIYFLWAAASDLIDKQLEASKTRNKLTSVNFGIEKVRDFGDFMNITLANLEKKLSLANETTETIEVITPLSTDAISVIDVSGSMESCNIPQEAVESYQIWNKDSGEVYCGERLAFDYSKSQSLESQINQYCYPQKIDLAIKAQKEFITKAFEESDKTKIGIVEYSSPNTVKNLEQSDLTTSLYIGSEFECYEKNIFEKGYDDSAWENASSNYRIYHQADCDNCRTFFRREFFIDAETYNEIDYLVIYKLTEDSHKCFINSKEVPESDPNLDNPEKVPKKYLKEGENIIVCSVQKNTGGYHRFFLELITNKGFLVPLDHPIKKISDSTTDDMVLHYSFGEYNNTIKDDSSKKNNGEIVGNGVQWHELDKSMFFEGDSYINAGNSNSLQLDDDLTIEFWINPRFIGVKDENIIQKNRKGEFSIETYNGRLYFYNGNSGSLASFIALDAGTIKNNQWQHIVITRDKSTRELKSYYNGKLNKTITYSSWANPIEKTTSEVYIGAGDKMGTAYGAGFRGRLDEIAIYDKILTDEEIKNHYENTNPGLKNWKKKTFLECGATTNPKYVKARKGVQTNFTLIATIRNTGPKIDIPFDLTFYEDSTSGPVIKTITINELGALDTKEIIFNWHTMLNDDKTIYAKVDSGETIPETSDTNNEAFITINNYDFNEKDLVITDIDISPHTICSGLGATDYEITATVKNTGIYDITNDFDVSFYNNSKGNLIKKITIIGGINKGLTKEAKFTWENIDLNSDTIIESFADSENVIAEGNETNNNNTAGITKRLPDMYSHSLTFSEQLCEANKDITITATSNNYIYTCPLENDIEHILTMTKGNLSDFDILKAPFGPIPPQSNRHFPTTRTFNFITPEIGEVVEFYTYIDPYNNQPESNENNNNRTYGGEDRYIVGPNLPMTTIYRPDFFVEGVEVFEIEKGVPTDLTVRHYISIKKCAPITFNMSVYKGSFSPENYLGSTEYTINNAYTNNYPEVTLENFVLNEDTDICVVADPNNEIKEYNEDDNIECIELKVKEPTPTSIFPNIFKIKLKPWFLEILGLRDSACTYGTDTNIASNSIISTFPIKNKDHKDSLLAFIDETKTWWDTCTCCGINKSIEMLESSSADNKIIILMSDGAATQGCYSSDPKADAIEAAKKAYEEHKIIVHTVCFGEDCDTITMKEIADKGNGTYFEATDATSLNEAYETINKDISTAVKKEYKPKYDIDHLRFIFYNETDYFIYETSNLPGPLETNTLSIPPKESPKYPLNASIKNVDKIEIYAVMIDSYENEYTSAILDTYEF